MDMLTATQLAAYLAPALPFLTKGGEEAVKEAGKKLGAAVWEQVSGRWKRWRIWRVTRNWNPPVLRWLGNWRKSSRPIRACRPNWQNCFRPAAERKHAKQFCTATVPLPRAAVSRRARAGLRLVGMSRVVSSWSAGSQQL